MIERPTSPVTEPDPAPIDDAPVFVTRGGIRRGRRPRGHKALLIAVTAALGIGAGLAGIGFCLRPPRDRICPGVSVWGVAIGGKTPRDARQVLAQRLLPALERPVRLVDGSRSWEMTPRQLGISFDLQAISHSAYAVGRQGGLLRQIREGWAARRKGVPLKPHARFDRRALRERLRDTAGEADAPAEDARISLGTQGFVISSDRVGRVLDIGATEKNVVRYFAPLSHRDVKLVMREDRPRVTAADLRQINGVLASFTTHYNPGDANRSQNLELAARALHSTVVPAGAVFSYNDTVGPRTEARGYRVAKIFLKGEILDGVGGGICQVATTLYNAALEARMRILERGRHSRPVVYAPPGRDATVSYGSVDLRFRNTTTAPILIRTRMGGGVLVVSIFGKRSARVDGDHAGAATRGTKGASAHNAG